VLFIDEIHRFNKAQQDALLPFVESGAVILIGATTENPYFEVNAALVSRSGVYLSAAAYAGASDCHSSSMPLTHRKVTQERLPWCR
jgi:replication-associated recombination protein RarA